LGRGESHGFHDDIVKCGKRKQKDPARPNKETMQFLEERRD
jgi:hypothetical protein